MTTPDNRVIQYAYDNANRLTGITPQTGQTFTFGYDSAGRRASLSYPNGVAATYSYDNRNRLTSLVYNTSTNSTIDSFTYTLDSVGNRLTRTDRDYQYAFTYDQVYRLTQSQPSPVTQSPEFSRSTEDFTFDAVGNRLTGPAYSKAQGYTQNYSYDTDNRLVGVTKQVAGSSNTDTITFKYDPFGRRVEKNVSTIENTVPTTYKYIYVYDNEDIILEVLDKTQNGNTTTTTTAYTHGPGIDEPLSMQRGGQTYYYHADGLGSITSLTDSTQAVVNRYSYDSFGVLSKNETVKNVYAFTGREYDSEISLYYLRARYYDPEAGRFIGKDPIGFKGGDVNVYNYVLGNPVNDTDPLGLYGANGANSCAYYAQACSTNGGTYECYVAGRACEAFKKIKNNTFDCIRQCLQEKHKARQPKGQCSEKGREDIYEFYTDHRDCFKGCLKNPENPYNPSGPDLLDGDVTLY